MANLFHMLMDRMRDVANTSSRMAHDMEHDQAKLITDLKYEAWHNAHKAIERDPAQNGRTVSWSDYSNAADAIYEARQDLFEKYGVSKVQWNNAMADQSGMRIGNAVIRKEEINPSRDVMGEAIRRAKASADTNPQNYLSSVRNQVRQITDQMQNNPNFKLPSTSMEQLMDLDDNHTISTYYEALDHAIKFENTVFSDVTFHPAGTLTKYHSEGASFKNCVFDGMGDDSSLTTDVDQVTLKNGKYQNIQFTNIKGGVIHVADGAQVDGMDIRGARATLVIDKASVNHLDATGAHLVSMHAAPGAVISHSKFDGSTIDMKSTLEGVTLKSVDFNSTNLAEVDMKGASLINVNFKNSHVKELDLSGAKLSQVTLEGDKIEGMKLNGATISNMVINGQVMRTVDDLKQFGVEVDATTKVTVTPEFAMQRDIASIRTTMQAAVESIGHPASPVPQAAHKEQSLAEAMAVIRQAQEDAGIKGGQTVTEAGKSLEIANMKGLSQGFSGPALPGRTSQA